MTSCPQCGATVSPYAAGCERCGADLVKAHRRARIAAENAPPPPWWRKVSMPDLGVGLGEAFYAALTTAAVLWITVLGLVMALIGALHGWYEDRYWLMAVFAGLSIVALILELGRL